MKHCLSRGYLIDSPIQEFVRQTNNNNFAGMEMPAQFAKDGDYHRLKDTSFNPMKYEGYRLVEWNKFYGRRYHLSHMEWLKIKDIMSRGHAEADGISPEDFSCTPIDEKVLDDFWLQPDVFWMRVVPLEKLYCSFKYYTSTKNQIKSEMSFKDFLASLGICFPRFKKRTLVICDPDSGVTGKQDFLFIPDHHSCNEFFKRQHPHIHKDSDIVDWKACTELKKAPRLDVITSCGKDILSKLQDKQSRCQHVNLFVDKVKDNLGISAKSMYKPLHEDIDTNRQHICYDRVPYFSVMKEQIVELESKILRMKRKLDEKDEEIAKLRLEYEENMLKTQEMLENTQKVQKIAENVEMQNQAQEWDFSQPAAEDTVNVDDALRNMSSDSLIIHDSNVQIEVI